MGFNKERSTNYRQTFFSNNKPFIKDRYFCAYCGKLVKKRDITIDHLFPIDAVKKSFYSRLKMRMKGFNDINDVRILVPACLSCNQRKSNKTGLWILKGKIGRSNTLWIIRKIFKVVILCFIGFMILQNKEVMNYVTTGANNIIFYISNSNLFNKASCFIFR